MKYFLIEGIFASLKSDMSASVTIVKSQTEQIIQDFYREDPFFKNSVITYSISELDIHCKVSDAENWFQN